MMEGLDSISFQSGKNTGPLNEVQETVHNRQPLAWGDFQF